MSSNECGLQTAEDRVRAAFLSYVQFENECARTGLPCRDQQQCGCWLEMEQAITDRNTGSVTDDR